MTKQINKKTNKLIDKKGLVEDLRAANPYPEDIFVPMTQEELKKIRNMFKDNNIIIDKFSAHCMRLGWNFCVDEIEMLFALMEEK